MWYIFLGIFPEKTRHTHATFGGTMRFPRTGSLRLQISFFAIEWTHTRVCGVSVKCVSCVRPNVQSKNYIYKLKYFIFWNGGMTFYSIFRRHYISNAEEERKKTACRCLVVDPLIYIKRELNNSLLNVINRLLSSN